MGDRGGNSRSPRDSDTDGDRSGGESAHAVTFEWPDGHTATVAVDPGERIVDAAEAAGVELPYGCLHGACATCTAELLDGAIEHVRPVRGLKPAAVEEGYVLPCIATPRSDCLLRVGHAIQAEVIGTPWK